MSSKIILKQESASSIESVSAGYGTIFVDSTDSKAKVKLPGSTEVLASESYVNSEITSGDVNTISLVAGENITENDAIRKGVTAVYESKIENTSGTARADNDDSIGLDTTNRAAGQSFTVVGTNLLWKFKARLLKANSPTGNLTCYIYSDAGITLVATSTNTINEATLTDSYVTFTFNNVSLVAGLYYAKIATDRVDSGSNFSRWRKVEGASSYSGGLGYTINSVNTWSTLSGSGYTLADRMFVIEFSTLEDTTKAYLTDATQTEELDFIGFAQEAKSLGEAVKVQVAGVKGGFTGLTQGRIQNLSETPGLIQDTTVTNNRKVGVALTATQVKIVDIPL